jgi:hypothetical protein
MTDIEMPGSFIIGGLLLVSLMGLYFWYSNFTSSKNINAIVQTSSIELKKVIDYDFNKIGFRTSNTKITAVDSNSISFQADLDNNGIVDTISYAFKKYLTRTVKPGAKTFQFNGIDNFIIACYDSTGQKTYQTKLIRNVAVKVHFNGKYLLTDTTFTALSYLEARYNVLN